MLKTIKANLSTIQVFLKLDLGPSLCVCVLFSLPPPFSLEMNNNAESKEVSHFSCERLAEDSIRDVNILSSGGNKQSLRVGMHIMEANNNNKKC